MEFCLRGESSGKVETDGKNKQIRNNEKVNKVQQSKNGRNNQDIKTGPEGNNTNRFKHRSSKKDKNSIVLQDESSMEA